MPWSGSGSFTRVHDWTTDRDGGIKIQGSRFDAENDDFAAGIQAALAKNGENAATANLNLGGFRFTNAGNATAADDLARVSQIQSGSFNYAAAGGTADVITLSLSPAITAYSEGVVYCFQPSSNNATTTPTLNINSVGAKTIVKRGSAALEAGDIVADEPALVVYNSTDDNFTLINPAVNSAVTPSSTDTLTNKTIDGDDNTLQDLDFSAVMKTEAGNADKLAGYATTTGAPTEISAGTGITISGGTISSAAGLPRSYLAGLGLSNNVTDGDHDVDIAAGACRDSANAADITLAAITKRIDASWSAGTGNGGLSSSLTVAADTWYHMHALIVSGAADVGFDTSITAANLVTDHSATAYRRLGSVLTDGSSNIIAFKQLGDRFLWLDPPLDLNTTTLSTTAQTPTLSVPLDVQVRALINIIITGGTDRQVYISSPDVNDEAPSLTAAPLSTAIRSAGGSVDATSPGEFRTNTSSQVRIRSTASSTTARIATLGWFDGRGRDD